MTIIKPAAIWLLAQIRKELTIQKPTAEQAQAVKAACKCRQKSRGSDAIKGILIIIIAPIIFVILAGLVL